MGEKKCAKFCFCAFEQRGLDSRFPRRCRRRRFLLFSPADTCNYPCSLIGGFFNAFSMLLFIYLKGLVLYVGDGNAILGWLMRRPELVKLWRISLQLFITYRISIDEFSGQMVLLVCFFKLVRVSCLSIICRWPCRAGEVCSGVFIMYLHLHQIDFLLVQSLDLSFVIWWVREGLV